jgi:HSP20 family protein
MTQVDSVLSELQEMKHRMDRLYSQSMGGSSAPCENENEGSEPGTDLWEPLSDIWETESAWIVELDLPGVLESELQVEVKDEELSVRGHRRVLFQEGVIEAAQSERPFGRFSRSFKLPPDASPERIQAGLKSGVLTLTIPKRDKDKTSSHRIEVRSE